MRSFIFGFSALLLLAAAPASAAEFVTTSDTDFEPPSVVIVSPADGSSFDGTPDAVVPVTIEHQGYSAPNDVSLWIDEAEVGACPEAPPCTFEVLPDRTLRGEVTLHEGYNGPPWNLAHGGVIAAIFDELLGVGSIAAAGGGFTGRLTVNYRKPTPILVPIELTLRAKASLLTWPFFAVIPILLGSSLGWDEEDPRPLFRKRPDQG